MVSGCGSADTGGGSTTGSTAGGAGFAWGMMLCASMRAFFCASRAILVLSAVALPAVTCFGFFCHVAGVFEVTCWTCCDILAGGTCGSAI